MKRIILFFCFGLILSSNAVGQDTYLFIVSNYTHTVETDDGICSSYTRFFVTEEGGFERELFTINGRNSGTKQTNTLAYQTAVLYGKPTKLRVEICAIDADSDWGLSSNDCTPSDNGTVTARGSNDLNTGTNTSYSFSQEYTKETCVGVHIFGGCAGDTDGVFQNKATFNYQIIRPVTLTASYPALPTDDRITLSVQDYGAVANAHYYQYSLDGVYWYNVPNVNSFSAKEIPAIGNNYISYVGTNVHFRVIAYYDAWKNQTTSQTISLPVMLSAPHIVSVGYEQETCYGRNDAKIKVAFDRQLFPGERLYVGLNVDKSNETLMKQNGTVKIEADNKAVIQGVASGTYTINLLGVYDSALKGSVNTFTESQRHEWNNFSVTSKTPLSLSVIQNPVHCKNGMDGKVNLTVAGGNNSYTAYLLNSIASDTLRRISVGTGTHAFSDLYQGSYQVYIKDIKGCDFDVNGAKVQRPITVTQPEDTVRISVISNIEAHGYGRSTGWAEVSVRGGSSGYEFTWSRQNSPVLMPQTGGTATTSRLENLRSDWYIARVKDQNYNQAYPRTHINTKGCMDTVHIFIDQPPKLIVENEESHMVTCHGDNDGQLQAHARGGRPFNSTQDNGRSLPYNYEWFKIENNTDNPIGTNDSILSNLYTGHYKVKITDRNAIDTTSLEFHLVEPDTLIAKTIALQQVLCDGDSTGRAQVTVTGGTPPYTYQWTSYNNDTTSTADNLPRDIYTVFVKDSRYRSESLHKRCAAESHINIQSPDGLSTSATVTSPSCHLYSDGKIELTVSGGSPLYRYHWEDGSTAQNRNNLTAGEYSITIIDANDCSITEKYSLIDPAPVKVDIGSDFTLCAGQQLKVKDANTHESASYQWTNGSSAVSQEPELSISTAGNYKLTVSTPEGCTGSNEITVGQSNDVLSTEFVIASLIPRGKTIHAVNIINTGVDSVEWILPDEAFVTEQTDHELSISFAQTGEYTIGLIGYLGQCRDIMYKTVQVLEASEIEAYADTEPFLKRFVVSPNPSDGNFTASVELREPSDYRLLLFTENGILIDSKEIRKKDREETLFRNELSTGVYYLRFVANEHASVFKLIIK